MTAASLPRPSDKWIPWWIALGFVVLISPVVPLAYIAIHTLPGTVSDKAYENGIAYNKSIAAGVKAAALGWTGVITYDQPAEGQIAFHYRLQDTKGDAVEGASVHLFLVRPVQKGMDRKATLQAEAGGNYSTTLDLPATGVWDVHVSATRGNENFQSIQRIVVSSRKP